MRHRWARRSTVLVLLAAASMAGCGSGSGGAGSGLVDGLAKGGVGAFAEGTWRCENGEANQHQGEPENPDRTVTSIIRIARDGRFSISSDGGFVDGAGTWTIDGLRLRLAVPWHDDGRNDFYHYVFRADQDPPTRIQGHGTDTDSVQDLKVSIDQDRITLSQKDAEAPLPDRSKPNYSWNVDCRRQSHDPGTIPPTIPPSDAED